MWRNFTIWWQQRNKSTRNLVGLLAASLVCFLILITTEKSWWVPQDKFAALLDYRVVEMRSDSSFVGPPPLISYYRTLGGLYSDDGVNWGWNGPGGISFDVQRQDAQSSRDLIIDHLNTSEENARELIRHRRIEIQLATWEAIQRECFEDDNRLAAHVYNVLAELIDHPDPCAAAYALNCFMSAKRWSKETFELALHHRAAVIRVGAIDFARYARSSDSFENPPSKDEALDVMNRLLIGLTDPHPAVRQSARMELEAYLRMVTKRSLQSDRVVDRAVRKAMEKSAFTFNDGENVTEQYVQGGAKEVEAWKEQIAGLRLLE